MRHLQFAFPDRWDRAEYSFAVSINVARSPSQTGFPSVVVSGLVAKSNTLIFKCFNPTVDDNHDAGGEVRDWERAQQTESDE